VATLTPRALRLLTAVHEEPGMTWVAAAQRLDIGTGAVTELVWRLVDAGVVAEAPTDPSGSRGRPTTRLVPHPAGPLVLAVSITHESWRVAAVGLGGAVLGSRDGRHQGSDGARALVAVSDAVAALRRKYADRIRGIGLAAPGTITAGRYLDASNLRWHQVDLAAVWPGAPIFIADNDATLAGAAEFHRGAAAGAAVALHIRVDAGLGGVLIDHGRVVRGALGMGGEFGHMPFGDPGVRCPCGAGGCWGTAVDGGAMARSLGRAEPRDPVAFARRTMAAAGGGSKKASRAVNLTAEALGRGLAGLVNGLDPDVVTLGGIGAELATAAPAALQSSYLAGLMESRRSWAPALTCASLGEDGPLIGAAETVWALLLTQL
jgi:predicted NBD/HSP70 family sugar kinase